MTVRLTCDAGSDAAALRTSKSPSGVVRSHLGRDELAVGEGAAQGRISVQEDGTDISLLPICEFRHFSRDHTRMICELSISERRC